MNLAGLSLTIFNKGRMPTLALDTECPKDSDGGSLAQAKGDHG